MPPAYRYPILRVVPVVVVALAVIGCSAGSDRPSTETATEGQQNSDAEKPETEEADSKAKLLPDGPTEKDYPELHNLLQVTDRIYTGGEPGSDEAFASLARLGVKTIVSVDGARPNVEAARKHGIRYVHIPFGYDGITEEAGRSLARLVREVEGPLYVHCHHGRHRGPAGAAVACIAAGAADGKEALAVLERAGTSKDYGGLWRDVEKYEPPPKDAELPELVEIAEVGSLVAAMAQIDRASDNLKLCEAVDWQTPPKHPDVAARQEALLLREGFRETVRQLAESNDRGDAFLAWMTEAEQSAEKLQAALESDDKDEARAQFTSIQDQCKRCHAKYRN